MAFNGDGPHSKRQRIDEDLVRNQHSNFGNNNEPRRKEPEGIKPNNILLFTIINPMYPITVDVLHTISQPNGQVLRIVIFKKNGVQAMVEFDSIESAIRAKEALNGADIYSGCCTLKIDFAKPEKLNVHKNDSESWDYTVSMLKENTNNGRPQPLLQEPHFGSRPQPYRNSSSNLPPWKSWNSNNNYNGPEHKPYRKGAFPSEQQRYDDICAGQGGESFGGGGGGGGPDGNFGRKAPLNEFRAGGGDQQSRNAPAAAQFHQPGSVLMVYGLDSLRTNADKVFNLMCLYGNVARIKFLKSKEGTAMVQMGDNVAVERCVQNLNNVSVGRTGCAPPAYFGALQDNVGSIDENDHVEHKLQLAFSKQPYLSEVTNPYPLPDKSPSYKEYITNKNNRFLNPAMASKNRIQPPSKILHFFNTPPRVTEKELVKVFKEYDVVPPKAVKLFPMKSERSSSGLLEFETIPQAVAAVMACNHAAIDSPGAKFPFIMKLCFSSSRNMSVMKNEDNNDGNLEENQRINE